MKYSLLRMVLCCALLLQFFSCNKDNPVVDNLDDDTTKTVEPILQSDLKLKANTSARFDEATRTVTMSAAEAADIAPGEVLLLSDMDNVGGRVLTKTVTGDQVTMTLAPLVLTDIFEQCSLRFDTLMTKELYEQSRLRNDVEIDTAASLISKNISASEFTLPGGATLEGTLSFLPNFNLDIDILDGSIMKFDAGLENPISYDFTLTSSAKTSLTKEMMLHNFPVVVYSFTIGIVPFYITVDLNVPLKVTGSCEGAVEVHLNNSIKSELTVGCSDLFDWDADYGFEFGQKLTAAQSITVSADAKAALGMGLVANLRVGVPTTGSGEVDEKSSMCSAAATLMPYMRVAGTNQDWKVFFGVDGETDVEMIRWVSSRGEAERLHPDTTFYEEDTTCEKLYYTSSDTELFDTAWCSSWEMSDPGIFMNSTMGEVVIVENDTLWVIAALSRAGEASHAILKFSKSGDFLSGVDIPTDDLCNWNHGHLTAEGDFILAGRSGIMAPAAMRVTKGGVVKWKKNYDYERPENAVTIDEFNSLTYSSNSVLLATSYALMTLDPLSGNATKANVIEAGDSIDVDTNGLSILFQPIIHGASGNTLLCKAGTFGGFVTMPYNNDCAPTGGTFHIIGWISENVITNEIDTFDVPTYATAIDGGFVSGYADQYRAHQISFILGGDKSVALRHMSPPSMLYPEKIVDMGNKQALMIGSLMDSTGSDLYGKDFMLRWDNIQFRWASIMAGKDYLFTLNGITTAENQSTFWCGRNSNSNLIVGCAPAAGGPGSDTELIQSGISEQPLSAGTEYIGDPGCEYTMLTAPWVVVPRAVTVTSEDLHFSTPKALTLKKITNQL